MGKDHLRRLQQLRYVVLQAEPDFVARVVDLRGNNLDCVANPEPTAFHLTDVEEALLVSQNLEPDFISYLALLTSTARDKNNRPKTFSLPYFVSACQMGLHKEFAKFL